MTKNQHLRFNYLIFSTVPIERARQVKSSTLQMFDDINGTRLCYPGIFPRQSPYSSGLHPRTIYNPLLTSPA